LTNRDGEVTRTPRDAGIVGQRQLRLRHADGKLREAECGETLEALFGGAREHDVLRAINGPRDLADLFLGWIRELVDVLRLRRVRVGRIDDLRDRPSELERAFPTLCESFRASQTRAERTDGLLDDRELLCRVVREDVDRDDGREAEGPGRLEM